MKKTEPCPPSVLRSWTQVIVRALEVRGIDGVALAKEAGIDVRMAADGEARDPITATRRLWCLACEATSDPSFGLFVSGFANPATFRAVGAAMLASGNLRDAFGCCIRYGRLVGNGGTWRLEEREDRYRLYFDVIEGPSRPSDEAIDAFLSLQVRTARGLHGKRDLNPLAVALSRPKPPSSDPYDRFFRAPVIFSAPASFLEFTRRDTESPLPAGNPDLARRIEEVLSRDIAALDEEQLLSRVRAIISERLPSGEPSQDAVARALGLGARTLQRRLAQEHTSYQEILNATREELAQAYLAEKWPVTEIAFKLGFSEVSSFSRAFRRWKGCPPSGYAGRQS